MPISLIHRELAEQAIGLFQRTLNIEYLRVPATACQLGANTTQLAIRGSSLLLQGQPLLGLTTHKILIWRNNIFRVTAGFRNR